MFTRTIPVSPDRDPLLGRRFAIWLGGVALAVITTASLGGAVAAHAAERASGIQLTPDSQLYLINKDVGSDRWAITYDLTHKSVTGNVFPLDGSPPQFIWCRITSIEQAPNPADAMYSLTCQAAQTCSSAPCSNQWGEPFPVPPIPGSFLLPTNTLATLAGNVQPIFTGDCTVTGCHGGGLAPDLEEGKTANATVGVPSLGDPSKDYVKPFDASASYLLDRILGSGGSRMPPSSPLHPDEVEAVRNWILEGAADN